MISLILSITAFVLLAVAWRIAYRENKRLREENGILEESLRKVNHELLDECKASLDLDLPIEYKMSFLEGGGVIVHRIATLEGIEYYTAIKDFNDPDEDYNRLCAEELIEKLKEKQ